jgi:hypothetical protein
VQVVEHTAAGVQRGAVVLELASVCLLARGDRGGELGDIRVTELAKRAAGLDQHPHRHLAGQPVRDLGRVPQFGCRGEESCHITGQRAGVCIPQDGAQPALEQIVVARPQETGQHQVGQQRLGG